MGRILLNSILVAVMAAECTGRAAAQPADPASQLQEMQQRILRALLANNREEYAAMLAPEWRVTYVDGTVRTRAEVLDQVFAGPRPLLKSGRIDEVHVRLVAADLALVTGRTEATPQEGATVRLRFTDVAMKREGRWVITASFASFAVER